MCIFSNFSSIAERGTQCGVQCVETMELEPTLDTCSYYNTCSCCRAIAGSRRRDLMRGTTEQKIQGRNELCSERELRRGWFLGHYSNQNFGMFILWSMTVQCIFFPFVIVESITLRNTQNSYPVSRILIVDSRSIFHVEKDIVNRLR